jgi:Lon protease-like protein
VPDEVSRDFPLFPLGIVALPSEIISLHIFEARYRVMIETCLAAEAGSLESQFGILWLSDEELKPVGCACGVERVLERVGDGRMNILVRGRRPFRLLERQDELPYPAGTIEFLPDVAERPDEQAATGARQLYRDLVQQATDRSVTEEELSDMDAYRMAATVEFGVDAKQELLELRSENARLGLLTLLLKAAIRRVELVERAQERARSNGKVRFA